MDENLPSAPGCETASPVTLEPPAILANLAAPRSGDLCPKCQTGRIDYDGLLNLVCPNCGFSLGGCFT